MFVFVIHSRDGIIEVKHFHLWTIMRTYLIHGTVNGMHSTIVFISIELT